MIYQQSGNIFFSYSLRSSNYVDNNDRLYTMRDHTVESPQQKSGTRTHIVLIGTHCMGFKEITYGFQLSLSTTKCLGIKCCRKHGREIDFHESISMAK